MSATIKINDRGGIIGASPLRPGLTPPLTIIPIFPSTSTSTSSTSTSTSSTSTTTSSTSTTTPFTTTIPPFTTTTPPSTSTTSSGGVSSTASSLISIPSISIVTISVSASTSSFSSQPLATSTTLTTLIATSTPSTTSSGLISPTNDSATADQVSPLLRTQIIVTSVLSGIIILLLIFLAFFLYRYKRRRRRESKVLDRTPSASPLDVTPPPRHPLHSSNNLQSRDGAARGVTGLGVRVPSFRQERMREIGRPATMPSKVRGGRSDSGVMFQSSPKRPQTSVQQRSETSFPFQYGAATLQPGALRKPPTVILHSQERDTSLPYKRSDDWPLVVPREPQPLSSHPPEGGRGSEGNYGPPQRGRRSQAASVGDGGLGAVGSMFETDSGISNGEGGTENRVRSGNFDSSISTQDHSSLESGGGLGLEQLQPGRGREENDGKHSTTRASSKALPDEYGDEEEEVPSRDMEEDEGGGGGDGGVKMRDHWAGFEHANYFEDGR